MPSAKSVQPVTFYDFELIVVKIFIYAFLSEKVRSLPIICNPRLTQQQVYIVWTGGNQTPRLKAKVYRICGLVIIGYIVIAILMVLGRQSEIRDDDVCVIGLKSYAYVSLSFHV